MYSKPIRVLITGDNASTQFGGEAILPFHYFRLLNEHGTEAWLITHARCKNELEKNLPHLIDKMGFVDDGRFELKLLRFENYRLLRPIRWFPAWLRYVLFQWKQKKKIKEFVKKYQLDVVHQVIPVSPKLPSFIYDVGAPVIIGPMNGGMEYPPNFRHLINAIERLFIGFARTSAQFLNLVIPGKRHASLLLVANERTRKSLPMGVKAPVVFMIENGIDLDIWKPIPIPFPTNKKTIQFIFLGRLVEWKGVEYLIKAFHRFSQNTQSELHIIGDGPMKLQLENDSKNTHGKIIFHGHVEWSEVHEMMLGKDIFILPSLLECGGAAILEAMVCGLPVIATGWGGALDTLDGSCGILVPPDSENSFVDGLVKAMRRLADSPQLRYEMGLAGQKKIVSEFSWKQKINRMREIYSQITLDKSLGLKKEAHKENGTN